jgi:hypothetical protein
MAQKRRFVRLEICATAKHCSTYCASMSTRPLTEGCMAFGELEWDHEKSRFKRPIACRKAEATDD